MRFVLLFALVALHAHAGTSIFRCGMITRTTPLRMRLELFDATEGHTIAKALEHSGIKVLNPLNIGSSRFLVVNISVSSARLLLGVSSDIREIRLENGVRIPRPVDLPPTPAQVAAEDRALDAEREEFLRLALIARGLDPEETVNATVVEDPPVNMLIRLDEPGAGKQVAVELQKMGIPVLNPQSIQTGLNLFAKIDSHTREKLLRLPLGIERIVPHELP